MIQETGGLAAPLQNPRASNPYENTGSSRQQADEPTVGLAADSVSLSAAGRALSQQVAQTGESSEQGTLEASDSEQGTSQRRQGNTLDIRV